jgi:hypothetical protein
MSNLSTIKVEIADSKTWDSNITDYQVSLFNTSEWILAVCKNGNKPIFVNFTLDGQVIAKSAGLDYHGCKRHGKQLYFYSGPGLLEWDDDVFSACLNALSNYGAELGYAKIQMRPFDYLVGHQVEVPGYYNTRGVEMVLFFDEYPNGVYFSSGFKQNKKKAIKVGAVYKTSRSPKMVDELLRLFDKTEEKRMVKDGETFDPFYMMDVSNDVFYKLVESGLGVLHYVEVDGEIHCMALNLEKGKKMFSYIIGADDFSYENGLTSFLDYQIIAHAVENKFFSYNLGGLPSEEKGAIGIKRYKESLGCREHIENGYYSYFLTWPHKAYNPLLRLSKSLPNNRFINVLRRGASLINNIK